MNSIRKAAILVSALDRDSADALLDKMGPEQAARVRDAVFELDEISDHEQDRVVREFVAAGGGAMIGLATNQVEPTNAELPAHARQDSQFEHGTAVKSPDTPPAQLAAGIGADAWGHEFSDELVKTHPLGNTEQPVDSGPFPILREASIETLANHLAHENAQVIAVVVAHLPPPRAAGLIAQLPPKKQADVLRRVAALDAASPAAIEVLQRQLETKLTEELREQRNRTAGLAAVNSILDAAGNLRGELLTNLSENDNDLSQLVTTASATGAQEPNTTGSVGTKQVASLPPETVPVPGRNGASRKPVSTTSVASAAHLAARAEVGEPETGPAKNHPTKNHSIPASLTEANLLQTEDDTELIPLDSPPSQPAVEPITFEQVAEFDDESLAVLLAAIDPEVTLAALAGASPDFVDRVTQPLPAREAKALRRKMERLGPIRLSDIATAQREVARIATQLIQEGSLPQPAPPRFAVAA